MSQLLIDFKMKPSSSAEIYQNYAFKPSGLSDGSVSNIKQEVLDVDCHATASSHEKAIENSTPSISQRFAEGGKNASSTGMKEKTGKSEVERVIDIVIKQEITSDDEQSNVVENVSRDRYSGDGSKSDEMLGNTAGFSGDYNKQFQSDAKMVPPYSRISTAPTDAIEANNHIVKTFNDKNDALQVNEENVSNVNETSNFDHPKLISDIKQEVLGVECDVEAEEIDGNYVQANFHKHSGNIDEYFKDGNSKTSTPSSMCEQNNESPKDVLPIFSCGQCDRVFIDKETLDSHMRIHTGEKPFKCGQCYAAFAYKLSLVEHTRMHTRGRPYQCYDCEEAFASESQLKRHSVVHYIVHSLKCTECSQTFDKRSELLLHRKTHFKLPTRDQPFAGTGRTPFFCNCGNGFSSNRALICHIKNCVFTQSKAEDKPYKCIDCCASFITQPKLNAHKKCHSGCLFACNQCDKKFTWMQNLKRHKLLMHVDTRPFKCNECCASFKTQIKLNNHKGYHVRDMFHCDTCGRAFARKHTLIAHCIIHVTAKPFKCKQCNAEFIRKSYLKAHNRLHTGDLFACDECDSKFTWVQNLNRHKHHKHKKVFTEDSGR